MADKFVDISASFNGDGTSSAQATADGGVGAWNDLLSVCSHSPAYGAVDDGDVIYIRSNDGTNDLGITLSASFTFLGGSGAGSEITYLIDDGTIWANSGTFTIEYGNYQITIGKHSIVRALDKWKLYLDNRTMTSDNRGAIKCEAASILDSPYYENEFVSSSVGSGLYIGQDGDYPALLINPYIKMGAFDGNNSVICPMSKGFGIVINPTIDVSPYPNNDNNCAIFGRISYTYGFSIEVIGGQVIGGQDQHILFLGAYSKIDNILCSLVGFDPGGVNTEFGTGILDQGALQFNATCLAGTQNDFISAIGAGDVRYISSENYPYLNATLPDGRGWSYKIYPKNAVKSIPVLPPPLVKLYNLEDATKTLTIEMLLSHDYTGLTNNDIWLTATYVDSSGDHKYLSTKAQTDLETSTAGWSADYYGSKNYDKYKISITTPTAIKQNTNIVVQLFFAVSPITSTDYMFIDPEVLLT